MIDPKLKAMAIKNSIGKGGGGGFASDPSVNNNAAFPRQDLKPKEPQEPRRPQAPVEHIKKPLDDVESILSSLEDLSVSELKEVHDKSKEILETYFKELSEMFPKANTRRKKS